MTLKQTLSVIGDDLAEDLTVSRDLLESIREDIAEDGGRHEVITGNLIAAVISLERALRDLEARVLNGPVDPS